jgi:hypothetical protein
LHYRELVKPADAVNWFSLKPDAPANVLALSYPHISTIQHSACHAMSQ